MANKTALCIGINDYPGTGSDLAGCVNDANDWTTLLTAQGFTVKKLTDKNATRENILSAMNAIVNGAMDGDSVIIQYSGHGTYIPDENGDEPDGRDECLCPYDLFTKGPITDDELNQLFARRHAGVKLVFLSDSCHSGTVSRFIPMAGKKKGQGAKVKFLPPASFLSKKELTKFGIGRNFRTSSPPGRHQGLLISGCQDVEFSYDAHFNGKANGAFTYMAIKTFKQLKANASYADWFKAIRTQLPTAQYPQSPNFYGTTNMKKWKALK